MTICGNWEYAKNRQALANQQNAQWSLKKSAQLFDFPSVRWLLKHCRSQVGPSVKLTRIGLGFFGKNSWSPTDFRFDGTLATSSSSSSHKVMISLLIFIKKMSKHSKKNKDYPLVNDIHQETEQHCRFVYIAAVNCLLIDWLKLVWIPFKCQLGTAWTCSNSNFMAQNWLCTVFKFVPVRIEWGIQAVILK